MKQSSACETTIYSHTQRECVKQQSTMESSEDPKPDGNAAALIAAFCEITASTKQQALFFLESHNFDLDAAVSTFLDDDDNTLINPTTTATATAAADDDENENDAVSPSEPQSPDFYPSPSPSRSPSPSHSPSRAPYELRSRRSLGKKPSSSSSGTRRGGIRTFRDLNRGSGTDSEFDEPPPEEYYTGGQKSGMLVQDPTRGGGNSVDDIFDQARQVAVDPPPTENSSRSRSFSGTARLLSGETLPSAPQPVGEITYAITFWRNGFSINDGPLRRLDDPQNAPFIESIKKGECPRELEPVDRRTSVHVNLSRREENYPEPAKPRHLPFRGVGRTLGSSSSGSEAAGEPIQATAAAASSRSTAPTPEIGLVVDDSKPVTSIQLRLADGTRMVSRFNHHHTIRDIRAFIDASRPGGARSYHMQTMGFPPKQLTDLEQTIEQAGIANSVIIQKL